MDQNIVNKNPNQEDTPLIRAVTSGDICKMKELLEKKKKELEESDADVEEGMKAYVNEPGNGGYTPLMWAVNFSVRDVVFSLSSTDGADKFPMFLKVHGLEDHILGNGCSVDNAVKYLRKCVTNENDKNVITPFVNAVECRSNMIKLLIDNGADVNKRGNGLTPLVLAVLRDNLDIVKLLLDSGAKVEFRESEVPEVSGNTKEMQQLWDGRRLFMYAFNSRLDIAELLISHLSATTRKDLLFHTVGSIGNPKLVKFLLDHNTSTNERGALDVKVLLRAIEVGNLEIIGLLLDYDEDVVKGYNGKEALRLTDELMPTCPALYEKIKKLLIRCGAGKDE